MSKIGSRYFGYEETQKPNYSFIDAANMQRSLREALLHRGFLEQDHDLFDLSKLFYISRSDRYYVFEAIEEGKRPEGWIKQLHASQGYIFKGARLTVDGKGRAKKQQGVDVLLAVEALRCAFTKTMLSCTIFSCDGDFLPLIAQLVDLGVDTRVASFGDPDLSPVAEDLRNAADDYIHIGSEILSRILKNDHSVRTQGHSSTDYFSSGSLSEIVLNSVSHEVFLHSDGQVSIIRMPDPLTNYSPGTMIHHVTMGSLCGAKAWIRLLA